MIDSCPSAGTKSASAFVLELGIIAHQFTIKTTHLHLVHLPWVSVSMTLSLDTKKTYLLRNKINRNDNQKRFSISS